MVKTKILAPKISSLSLALTLTSIPITTINTTHATEHRQQLESQSKHIPNHDLIHEAAISNHSATSYTNDTSIATAISGNLNLRNLNFEHPEYLEPTHPIISLTAMRGNRVDRNANISQQLLRADSRHPSVIFSQGFQPWGHGSHLPGGSDSIYDHVNGTDMRTSNFVATTLHNSSSLSSSNLIRQRLARGRENDRNYIYTIHAPGGIDIESSLVGYENRLLGIVDSQREIAFFGGIQNRFIRAAYEYAGGLPTGTVIQNINFDPYAYNHSGGMLPNQNIRIPEMSIPNTPDGRIGNLHTLTSYLALRGSENSCSYIPDRRARSINLDSQDTCSAIVETEIREFNIEDILKIAPKFRESDGTFQIATRDMGLIYMEEKRSNSRIVLSDQNIGSHDTSLGMWKMRYDNTYEAHTISSQGASELNISATADGKVTSRQSYITTTIDNPEEQLWNIERDPRNIDSRIIRNKAYPNLILGIDPEIQGSIRAIRESYENSSWKLIVPEIPLTAGFYNIQHRPSKSILKYSAEGNNLSVENIENTYKETQKLNFSYNSTENAYSITNKDHKFLNLAAGILKFSYPNLNQKTWLWKIYEDIYGNNIILNYANSDIALAVKNNIITTTPYDIENEEQLFCIKKHHNKTIADGIYKIRSSHSLAQVAALKSHYVSSDEIKTSERAATLAQEWKISYNYNKKAYTMASAEDPNLFLRWNKNDNKLVVTNQNDDYQFWHIDTNSDGAVILRSAVYPEYVITAPMDGNKISTNTSFNVTTGDPEVTSSFLLAESQIKQHKQLLVLENTAILPQFEAKNTSHVLGINFQKNSCVGNICNNTLNVVENSNDSAIQVEKIATGKNGQKDSQMMKIFYNPKQKSYRLHFYKYGKVARWYSSLMSSDYMGAYSDMLEETDQHWDIIEQSDGTYLIMNREYPEKFLAVSSDSYPSSLRLVTENKVGKNLYTWNISSIDTK